MVGGTLHRLDEEIPMTPKSPVPPFTRESALQKVQAAEDAWNTCDPVTVSRAYTLDTVWRNRSEHLHGREEVVAFLTRKWERERDYRLRKNLWAFEGDRDRKSTRLNSSHVAISYAVFCLKKKKFYPDITL